MILCFVSFFFWSLLDWNSHSEIMIATTDFSEIPMYGIVYHLSVSFLIKHISWIWCIAGFFVSWPTLPTCLLIGNETTHTECCYYEELTYSCHCIIFLLPAAASYLFFSFCLASHPIKCIFSYYLLALLTSLLLCGI